MWSHSCRSTRPSASACRHCLLMKCNKMFLVRVAWEFRFCLLLKISVKMNKRIRLHEPFFPLKVRVGSCFYFRFQKHKSCKISNAFSAIQEAKISKFWNLEALKYHFRKSFQVLTWSRWWFFKGNHTTPYLKILERSSTFVQWFLVFFNGDFLAGAGGGGGCNRPPCLPASYGHAW